MQTKFDTAQLADPGTAAAAGAIRGCVHCGFCTATCPTYVLLGNELDSPRGRIYLIKEMLENGALPSAPVVKHLDRCLSCLACETHCPSGVSYRRIIDKGRAYVQEHYRRPFADRALRAMLTWVLPHRRRFRGALMLATLAEPLAGWIERIPAMRPLATLLNLNRAAKLLGREGSTRRGADCAPMRPAAVLRVGLAAGCVEPVLNPEIQQACVRLLQRAGCEIIRAKSEGCCGALSHHMGRDAEALELARANVDAWYRQLEAGPLAAIVVTASGCGPVIRDYGYMLRDDPRYAAKAARVAALACDLSELLERIGVPPTVGVPRTVVGYHAACSLQHGQRIVVTPSRLLADAGFEVREPKEAHLCCGSAGVYNILQPDIAAQLGARKAQALDALDADVIATGNIGCMVQIGAASRVPVVHIAQLLDWATGGPKPAGMS
ncbi:MAG TPA: glycolate oxidase subunit GlcF [Steroidobacteraceae bacterium]|nr:glycolate oxidase subunit GlcF [Steroidobacteraceae bacterium]